MRGKLAEGREDSGREPSCAASPITDLEEDASLGDQQPIQFTERSADAVEVVNTNPFLPSPLSLSRENEPQKSAVDLTPEDPERLSTNCCYSSTSKVALRVSELTRLINKHRKKPSEYYRTFRLSKQLATGAHTADIKCEGDPRPYAIVNVNGTELRGLLDSGASISCVGTDALETLHRCNLVWKEQPAKVRVANGQQQPICGFTDAPITFRGVTKRIRLFIIPSLSQQLYLGIDFWTQFGLMPKLEEIAIDMPTSSNVHVLDAVDQARLDAIKAEFPSCETEGLGKTSLLKHAINIGDAMPTKQRYHAVSPAVQQKMWTEIDRMLDLGIIELSQSAWSSPITIVTKANGKARLCLDARQLNKVTTKDAYPTPLIDGIISRLNDTRFISSIDLKDAFWQIELEDDAREKTAFTVPGRPLYQFVRMPFGLCNAGQSMCRLMDMVIPSEMRDYIFVYIDDLLIVSADLETHLERLRLVASCLRRANLTINVEKSKFCMRTIRYLGHIVGDGQIRPDQARVQCIVEFPVPTTVKQVRRFLGMSGWYQRYINNYAATASPITDTLRNTPRFQWTPEAQVAFETLKTKLTTAPVLTHPDFEKRFYIQCDASATGVGGVLFQMNGDEEHPIAFMSKKLNSAQRNYSVTEQECLAAILCVKKFRCYVEGMPFTIITDHASLKWLMSQKDLAGRLARWSLSLQAYDFQIEHRKGTANIVPDTLSRAHIDEVGPIVAAPVILTDPSFHSETYAKLKSQMEEHADRLPDIKVSEDVIYKRTEPRTGSELIDASVIWKIWVPEELRQKIISDAHDPPASSHGGVDKTAELVRRLYYWPGLMRDVRNFVSACETCKEVKAPNQTLRPPMGKHRPADRPFQHMYIDLLGPYPRSKRGNAYILIVLDQLTKFVWLKPLRKATAVRIIEVVETDIFHLFGSPETMLSDNGVQFVSREFLALLSRYGVRPINTGSHAPQANASERVNRSILAAIRAYIEGDQKMWDVHVSVIASALRNSVHATLGKSPYFAVFGQHMIQHAGTYALLKSMQSLPVGDVEVLPAAEMREELNMQMRERLQEAHERNTRSYNTRSRDVTYAPGQEVFRRNFKQSDMANNYNAKLGKQWVPARIVKRKGTCLYELEDRQGRKIKVAYHAKDIRV